MEYYEYVEFYNIPQEIMTPDEEFEDWAREHDPIPTEEEIQKIYEQMRSIEDGN